MPQTRQISTEQLIAASPPSIEHFAFPQGSHLFITTPSQIYAWDLGGIKSIFSSSKHGIVSACESKDGSGVLTVADKHVVVLHDTRRGQEQSWGLDAEADEVRHLEYTADAKSLFLTTNLTAEIQRYSTERARLLSPAKTHASPAVALAVSPTGHLMVSASEGPPVVYLKNLTHNSTPLLIEPRASKAAVSVAAFHPERPNIFLLAFKDGTIAAYDATRIIRTQANAFPNQERVNSAEISHFTALHRATSISNKRASITDAAFLPGYKTRAISVGRDGRCRIVDFANGATIIRTWHAKAPVTSVSILSLKSTSEARSTSAGSKASHLIGGPTSTNNLIAVGRADGDVHLYDSVGLLLSAKNVGEGGERIISVEWVKGPSPTPVHATSSAENAKILSHVPAGLGHTQPVATSLPANHAFTNLKARRDTTFEHIGLPPALRKPLQQTSTGPARRFTIHPNEMEDEGTVRHTPAPASSKPKAEADGEYLDLFSPVKPQALKTDETVKKRVASPPRSRPRLSSQTFMPSPGANSATKQTTVVRQRNLALFPSTDSGADSVSPKDTKPAAQNTPLKISPLAQRRRVTFKSTSRRRSRKSSAFDTVPAQQNHNAKILADLRKMSATHPAHRRGGVLTGYATATDNQGRPDAKPPSASKGRNPFKRPVDHVDTTDLSSENARQAYHDVHIKGDWPEDSHQDSSLAGDIWLTSDSEGSQTERDKSRRRRHRPMQRPPARQISRTRIDSKGTISTLARTETQEPVDVASKAAQHLHHLDGSTDDENMYTAASHVSPDGTFSPSSNEVRELFPRTSSLLPRKWKSVQKRSRADRRVNDRPLREVVPNTVSGKSPWARARAGKTVAVAAHAIPNGARRRIETSEDGAWDYDNSINDVVAPCCGACATTRKRAQALEAEVAHLKGEVLTLKAVLRRSGAPMPQSLRHV